MKRIIISLLSLFAGLFVVLLGIFIVAVVSNINVIDKNIKFQEEHLKYLETEYYKNYTPKKESDLASFDLEKEIENLIISGIADSFYVGNQGNFDLMVYKCLKELSKKYPNIQIEGIYTHFSKPIDEKWTRKQYERFIELTNRKNFESPTTFAF